MSSSVAREPFSKLYPASSSRILTSKVTKRVALTEDTKLRFTGSQVYAHASRYESSAFGLSLWNERLPSRLAFIVACRRVYTRFKGNEMEWKGMYKIGSVGAACFFCPYRKVDRKFSFVDLF